MSSEKSISLHFDKFIFTVSYSTLKKFILEELKRLSKETGYSIKNLKIEFNDNNKSSNTIAYFSHSGDTPIGFCFHLNMFDNTSPNKIIDTCRHEFAHYVVCMQNSGQQPTNCHGTKWKKICNELDAIPSPFMNNALTRHLI